MDRLFIDTNVIIDYLAARQPFDASAKVLFQLAEERQIEICASVLSLCNIAYIYRKISPGSNIRQILSDLSVLLHVTSVDNVVFADANTSLFVDIEDAVQHFSALHYGGVHYLITRDPKGFEHSMIKVLSPEEYLQKRAKQ